MRESKFEYHVREMVKQFMKENDETLNKKSDINDVIWENKEEFGEIAYNIICEYFGSDFITEIFEENKEELIEDDGEEGEEE